MTFRGWVRLVAVVICACSAGVLACSGSTDRECRHDPQMSFATYSVMPVLDGPCTFSIGDHKATIYDFTCDPCEAGVPRDLDCVNDDTSAPPLTCKWTGDGLNVAAEGNAAQAVFDYLGSSDLRGQFDCIQGGSIPTSGYSGEDICAL